MFSMICFVFHISFHSSETKEETTFDTTFGTAQTSFMSCVEPLPSSSISKTEPTTTGYEGDEENDDDDLVLSGSSSLPSSIPMQL